MDNKPLRYPSRVLMTADAVGGVWTYALELARALERFGTKVMLATMGETPNSVQAEEARRIPNLQLVESGLKLEWMEDCWDDVHHAGKWLLSLENRFSPDVIHLNGFVHADLPWRAPTVVVGHSCVLSWWKAVKNEKAPAVWDTYKKLVSRGLQRADLIVAPTSAMLRSLEENYGYLQNTRTIANARDPELFRVGQKEDFVLAAGRLWDEGKNVTAVANAAKGLSVPVCVAGDDAQPKSDGRIQLENVHMLGRLSSAELSGWMSRAAVFALPARYEPFGLSPLEAALSGCALVLGDIPSLREVWGEAAVFVPPDDEDALADALHVLINDGSVRERFANKAYHRALEFNPRRMATRYLTAYAEMLSNVEPVKEAAVCG